MRHKAVCFPPVTGAKPHTLILGSMPGIKSLQARQYYAHPQNGFWKILGKLFDASVETYEQRMALICGNGLALWDVLKFCERQGSLDAKIDDTTIEVNDFAAFLRMHPKITRIFFNGEKAEREFIRRALPDLPQAVSSRLTLKRLPSTSPANASMRAEKKLKFWLALLQP